MAYNIIAGTTADLKFQLFESGMPIDLSGISVSLLLEDHRGVAIRAPGIVSVDVAATGEVKLVPASATTFVAANGPYYARWQLTDGFGKVSYVPTSIRDVWNIISA